MTAMSFGYKTAWFAVHTADTRAVADALGLRNLRPSSAEDGIAAGYGEAGQVFLTPPVRGWTLAMSQGFLDLADGAPPAFAGLLPRLSAELQAEVQFFASHRVAEAHAWARATHGELARAYAYNGCQGEVQIDQGGQTADEIALGHRFFNPAAPQASGDAYWERDDLRYPNEEDVMQVAGAWSVDPQSLEALRDGFLADGGVTSAAASKASTPTPAGKPWWRIW
ncbi:MAG: hypothetical protein EOP35_00905 [Rubrivivax sp.]|nr:MAG: hypothetical protein EOP35_00905 [Rubrivivax sp.]